MAAKKPVAKITMQVGEVAPVDAPKADEPKAVKYADDDNSIDARMARLLADHQKMGARPK